MEVKLPQLKLNSNLIAGKKIYAIDDEIDSLELISAILKNSDAKIYTFTSGKKFIQTIEKNPADLYIIDVMMPEMDGWILFDKIRSIKGQENTPVIFTSGLFNEYEAKHISSQQKYCKIISKPLELTLFNKTVFELICSNKTT